ncbi:hypothetical protein AB833_02610 [Chromatiales bacterium (ex Bugula neritina AB1)]|nr:hypothetical protein AB833_02610 [Chromatiales bacterium (ex Bugula neritina AB1)]
MSVTKAFVMSFIKRAAIRDGVYVGAGLSLTILSGLALTVVCARALTIEEFAAVNWILGLLTYFAVLGQVGSAHSGTVLSSQIPRDNLFHTVFKLIGIVVLASSVVSVAWYFFIKDMMFANFEHVTPEYLLVSKFLHYWVPIAALLPVVASVFRGIRRFDLSSIFGDHIRRFAIIISLVLLMFFYSDSASLGVIVVFAIAIELVALLFAILLLKMKLNVDKASIEDQMSTAGLFNYTSKFYLAALAAAFVPQSAVWLLPFTSAPIEVANMSIAVRVSFIISIPFFIAGKVLAPRIAKAAGEANLKKMEGRLRAVTTMSFLFGFVMLFVFWIYATELVNLLFGAEYRDAVSTILLLSTAKILGAVFGFWMLVLSSSGLASIASKILIGYIPVYCALVYFITQDYGANGAAIATIVYILMVNVHSWVIVKRLCGINTAITFTGLRVP